MAQSQSVTKTKRINFGFREPDTIINSGGQNLSSPLLLKHPHICENKISSDIKDVKGGYSRSKNTLKLAGDVEERFFQS